MPLKILIKFKDKNWMINWFNIDTDGYGEIRFPGKLQIINPFIGEETIVTFVTKHVRGALLYAEL